MFKFQSWLSVFVVLFSMSMYTLSSADDLVDLGTAGCFAILSKSGVTNTGSRGSEIDGNVGTSPIAATALTGFALTPTNAGTAEFSKSAMVTGNLYGASHLAPTPAMLTVAVSDMEAAYTDVSGRPHPDEVELFAGTFPDTAVLVPGIYKWSNVVTVPVGGTLTFAGSSTDKWIMQIAGNFALGTDATMLLTGGAKAENIFWAVHGDIAFNVDAHAEGIFLTYTMIAMKTRSSLNGAAYAQTEVTLDDVTIMNDTTGRPTLSGVPADITVECNNVPAASTDVTASDMCDSSPVVSYDEVKSTGDCVSGYTLTRTWYAINSSGKIASESQTITVLGTPVLTTGSAVYDDPSFATSAGGAKAEPLEGARVGVNGDPHFRTWAGVMYDYHGICDLMLINHPGFNRGVGMEIHIRSKRTKQWSYISTASIRIGSETLEVAGRNDGNSHWLNMVEIDQNMWEKNDVTIEGYPVHHHKLHQNQREYFIELGNDETITIRTWKDMVRVDVLNPKKETFDGSLGLMGSYPTGVMLGRDGKALFTDLNKFGQEWQVLSYEPNLFHIVDDGPQHPEKCEVPSKTSMRRRMAESNISIKDAEIACAHVMKTTEEEFDLCVFDVMAIGDKTVAGAY